MLQLLMAAFLKMSQQQSEEGTRLRAVFKLGTKLVQVARNSKLDEQDLRTFLKHIKEQYLRDSTTSPQQHNREE